MNIFKSSTSLLFIFICFVSFAQAQVKGTVVDSQNIPIIGATISLKSEANTFGKLTDDSGQFEISAPTGNYSIEIRYLGFQSYKNTIEVSEDTAYDIGTVTLEDGPEQLQSVEVIGRARTDYNSDYSFSSTKIAIANKELPQAISTVTKELFQDKQAFQIADAISTASGVNHTGNYNHFSIRGLIKVEDGQVVNGLRTRQFYFLQPITSHIERAEVIKGPSSVTFSSVDPGGTVNMVTKKPLKEKRSEISATVGSFGTLRATADFTGPLNKSETLLYRLNAAVQEARSFRDLVQNNQLLVSPSVTFKPNNTTALNVEMIYSSGEGNLDRGQPLFGAINGEFDLRSTDVSTNVAAANDFYISNEFLMIGNFNKQITDNIGFNASYMKQTWEEDLAEHRVAGSAAVDIAGNPIPTLAELRYTERQQFWITDNYNAYINFDLEKNNITNKLLIGYDGSRWERTIGGASNGARRYRRLNGTATSFDPAEADQFETIEIDGVIAPRPNVDHFNLADPNNTARETSGYIISEFAVPGNLTTSDGIYIQNQFKIGKFSALLNLRYDFYEDIFDYKGEEQSFKNEAFIPRIGLTYEVSDIVSVYGSYIEGFQPQANTISLSPFTGDFFFGALPSNFDPLESSNVEVGAKAEFLNGRLAMNAAVYSITQKNLLIQDPNDETVLTQRGEQRSRGFEWDVNGHILPNLQISASYSFIDAEIIEDDDPTLIGDRVGGTPEHSANFWGKYDFSNGYLRNFGVGLGVQYRGDSFSWFGDRLLLPDYTVVDAAAYYRPSGSDIQISLKVNNVFDKTYWNGALNGSRLFPGAPRNIFLTTTYKF
ncbi:TonB-dependent receptor [Aquimarina algicola]|uniref:TonB-dependent receptor n=1 Tax=Aquimarina algicola TaxID=2589995 RepID=A0A504J925_9FLAO|nr:TonB-dependent receptor [Aquimarina algicola]TPN87377.1 TonB-dependent receptor [Aquimarina algicola]